MDNFTAALNKMNELFGRDYQFVLATVREGAPFQRFVDTYFDGNDIYIVAYGLSNKVRDIEKNPEVCLCGRKNYSFSGRAYNIGHPLKPENREIREKLIKAFEPWYFLHNNEQDENMCYIKVELKSGFFHHEDMGYSVDFVNRTAEIVPFVFSAVETDD
ncbi:MAG: pyridoxamine 5'-phosphate oxidase family protein [Oscillospiraceae bacterium]|nr:pyridoxamine 5'-phosphate oxidase family protein [Oscillospiraceae bacterium]